MKARIKLLQNRASFRDPSGFVYSRGKQIYRQINLIYKEDYETLIKSGLYSRLVKEKLLCPHEEIKKNSSLPKGAYKIIKPTIIPFISYPYEWCFNQMLAAALLTLKIQALALEHQMILKDATSYNVQFIGTRPIFIDELSFEKYQINQPWIAYRQFCQHFLAPLALMAMVDLRLGSLLVNYLDGIPLDLTSKLLPKKSLANFGLLTHLHLQAKSQSVFAGRESSSLKYRLGKKALANLVKNLSSTIRKLKPRQAKTTWSEYYSKTNYSPQAFAHKQSLVRKYLAEIHPKTVLDLGANTGLFSQIAAKQKAYVLSVDNDPLAVEKNFQAFTPSEMILPLVVDFTNPSPSIGWKNLERTSFLRRTRVEAVLALALVHHLAIGHNLPLGQIASLFKDLGPHLIIEFIPKSDSQVKRLLSQREDIFPDYHQKGFKQAFGKYYHLKHAQPIKDSQRVIYMLEKNV